jgi:predicted acylesterase/phospholipase RssA
MSEPPPAKLKVRVVLPGGGAKGAWQVGFLKELLASGEVEIDKVYGTSVGAGISPFVAANRMDLGERAEREDK